MIQIRRNFPETSSSSASALIMISSAGKRERVKLDKPWKLVRGAFLTDWDGCPHLYLNRWQEKMSLLAYDTPAWHRMFKKATGQDFVFYKLYSRDSEPLDYSEINLTTDDRGLLWATDGGYICGNNMSPGEATALRDPSVDFLRDNQLYEMRSALDSWLRLEELPKFPDDDIPDERLLEELIFNPGFAIDVGGDAFNDDDGLQRIPFSKTEYGQLCRAAYSVFENVYRNGNETLILGWEGSKIRMCDKPPEPEFPDSIDLKITDCCCHECAFCYENSTPEGLNGEIPDQLFRQIPRFTEIAVGGGDPLMHPEVFDLPEKYGLHMNLTLHAQDFLNLCLSSTDDFGLKQLKKFGAVGISVTNAEDAREVADYLAPFMLEYERVSDGSPDAKTWDRREAIAGIRFYGPEYADNFIQPVIHVINGIASPEILQPLYDKKLRLLVLGFKSKGRGVDIAYDKSVTSNQKWLYDNISEIAGHFSAVAFDTLALEQLDIRRFFTDEEWDCFYMGDDGRHSMYIDLVKREYGISSTDSRRFPLTDDLREMFQHVRSLSSQNK